MPGSLLGNSVRRVEDPDLLTGKATYVGNLRFDGLACAAFVRSPMAHARLAGIDTSEAARAPGVLAVYTAADLNLKPFALWVVNEACARPPLATGKVRFVGDAVAVVIAETEVAAADAAELVSVDYEPLDTAVDMEQALADGAPVQFEELGTNLVAGTRDPNGTDPDGTDPLAGAATVVRACLENQRVAVVPMECDAVAAVPGDDGDGHDLTVYVSTQMPHGFAKAIARNLDLDPATVRVIAPHVGGAFGSKAGMAAEHAVVIAAAQRLGRPVRWVQTRSDNLMSMPHGRGQVQWIEMGFDAGGHITGMHCRMIGDCGAYGGFGGSLVAGSTRMMAQGVYEIPRINYDVAVAVTNTTPMGAFRGAGRPEAAEFLERMMDIAADELDIDPVELRRRNLRPAFDSPVQTVMGTTYDTGDYAAALDEALRRAGYEELLAEQAARRAAGARLQLGIGVAVYVEVTAGAGGEFGAVEVHRDGSATIRVGTSAHGQGHATAFSMIVSETLGLPMDRIRFVQSDTAVVPRGGGTGGSRSLQLAGSAVMQAAERVLEQARSLTASELEAAAQDIVVHDDGRLGVAGVPARGLSWSEVAALAAERDGQAGDDASVADGGSRSGAGGADGTGGAGGGGGGADGGSGGADGGSGGAGGNGRGAADGAGALAAELDFNQEGATFPFGAHVSVVEVDIETGQARPVRHIAVDDCGRILNPLLVTGQQHGGIAQGMAQALWEQMLFDADGNPITATLADYSMPSAAEFPSFDTANTQTPTFQNPLGAKGIGESGTIGSTPSVHNAVIDAVSHLGVRHIPMPCTPERVWQAITAAQAGGPGSKAGGQPLWRDPPPVFDRLPVKAEDDDAESVEI